MEHDASWLTTEEALGLLHISRRTWNRWLRERPIERQIAYGDTGKSYLYSRDALLHLVREMRGDAVAESVASCPTDDEESDAPPRLDETGALALPPPSHVAEFLDLLADVRDVVARAAAQEKEVGGLRAAFEALAEETRRSREEAHQLREVLAARLPAPSPPAPQPRVRWRACTEVALLGVVTVLAGAMVAAVARVLQINGAIVLPW